MQKVNKYSRAVGPKLYPLLILVMIITAVLLVNSLYLSGVTFYQWLTDTNIQDGFYLWMFLLHLIIGLILVAPFVVYAVIHAINTRGYQNNTAKRAGYLLLFSALIVLITGLLLTRYNTDIEALNSQYRSLLYWLHVLIPILGIWLFVLHRLSGRSINFKIGKWLFGISLCAVASYLLFNSDLPETTQQNELFAPSLSTTKSGDLIPSNQLNNNEFCITCHEDSHQQWISSAHHFSSFNNQAYAFSVNNTKAALKSRDGHANAARFCASCHDPVLFFSGQFDDLSPAEQTGKDAMAGITCSSCHLVEKINSHQGNGAYQLALPIDYPLTGSTYEPFKWINQFLIKSKPDQHKTSYLKPLHSDAEFCSVCHKVSLPESLNNYRWLRGQNHYDSFLLSGVSGHKVTSFYYPDKAKDACQDCHMKPVKSDDISAKFNPSSLNREINDHSFDVANTAMRFLNDQPFDEQSSALLKSSLEIDLFGLKEQNIENSNNNEIQINANNQFTVKPGQTYQLETILKTKTLGHMFTQGTADSNQIWLELSLYDNEQLIAINGGLNQAGELNPFSHLVNAYVIDRDGNQISMRNPEDIFATLYNNQIPPGAASIIHYQLTIPTEIKGPLKIEAKLLYRKFNTPYYRAFMSQTGLKNDLPVVVIDHSTVNLSITDKPLTKPSEIHWQRWNDYGIALFRSGEYKQAMKAFNHVINMGQTQGLINAIRVHLKEGQITLAQQNLTQAQKDATFPYPWQIDYYEGRLHFINGRITQAINAYHLILNNNYPRTKQANFDFSKDYEFLTELAQIYLQKALQDETPETWLQKSQDMFEQILAINSEWSAAYYGLFRIAKMRGDDKEAELMDQKYQYYKLDDQNMDQAIQLARKKNPAADKAANRVVIYPFQYNKSYPLTLEDYQTSSNIDVLE